MELVPAEKLVIITTEQPILSQRNENMDETLLSWDFHVNSSLEIEVMLTKKHQSLAPREKYPRVLENITKVDFQNWIFISSGKITRQKIC